MTKQEFLEELAEVIDTEIELNEDTNLDEIDEYDSIAILSLINFYDELGVKVKPSDFENLKKVSDLIKLAGDKVE